MAYKLLNNCWNWRFKYFCRSISYRKLHNKLPTIWVSLLFNGYTP